MLVKCREKSYTDKKTDKGGAAMSDQYRPFGRKARSLAYIDHDWCIGCGYCAMFCITKCIYQQPDGFWTVDQEHCIGCRSCKVNCFMGAVTMLPPKQED
ncbi:MAG: hypothetical protein E7469_01635 [Ruminococcaceae bacterium]|nr:hypothetical protein [Oscillospiraceae bacterium]